MHSQQVMYEREISGYEEICMNVRTGYEKWEDRSYISLSKVLLLSSVHMYYW